MSYPIKKYFEEMTTLEGLLMTQKEAECLHVMLMVKENRITVTQAAIQLGICLRQAFRIWKRFKIEDKKGIISKRKGCTPSNIIPTNLKLQICNLLHTKYKDFGPTLASEKLQENEAIHISRESLRKIMIAENLWSSKRKNPLKIYQRRSRRSRFGELIQIDGSYEWWFEERGDKCCFLVFVDDATSKIVEMRFCKHETTQDYLVSLKRYIKRSGKPLCLYSDKHSIFRVNRENAAKGERITQFGRILKDLDIEIICANSPQAKGRVERKNGVLQDRLIKEMRLKGISSMEEGNIFLEEYREQHNKKFGKEPLIKEDAHRSIAQDDLEKVMTIQENRKLSKNLTFQYNNTIYQIQTDKPSYVMRYAGVTIINDGSNDIQVDYKGKSLVYKKWQDLPDQGRIVDSKALNWMNRKTYKPGKYHPWR